MNSLVTPAAGIFVAWLVGRWLYLAIRNAAEARQKLTSHRYQMMRDAKLCVKCHHDVRVSSGVCPECGWVIGVDP